MNELLKFKSVVTTYGNNKHTYEIESIDFTKSPLDTFVMGKGEAAKTVTFQEYYKEKYGVTLKDCAQPLIITKDRRTGKEIVLIPELCNMTGMTDEMRANFNLMKDLA